MTPRRWRNLSQAAPLSAIIVTKALNEQSTEEARMTRRPSPRADARPPGTVEKPKRGKPARKARPAPRGGWLDRALRSVFWALVGAGLRIGGAAAAVLLVAVWLMHESLPEPEALLDGRARGSVTLLDRHGDVFAWRGDQFGGALHPDDASPHLINAILAAEDRRFYSHWGVDPRGLARAMAANFRAGRIVQGGSTITQQVAKNVFLTNERSIARKLKEIPMAIAMELKYQKSDILAVYLNRVYLGAGAYGFEAASQRYFGKSARFVNPAEAAMLAGLLKAPSRFSPTSDIARAQGRANLVIRAMAEEGYLTTAEAEAAQRNPATLSQAAAARAGGQFADWVMESGPAYLTEATREDVLIRTSFDPRLQRAAEEALAHVFKTKVRPGSRAQAAIVLMTPDGAVRALVGGRGSNAGGFNRATQAMRQTGSAFKPIVYAAALERGFSPNDVINDAPLTLNGWSPANYGGEYVGPVTLTRALAESINTVAVRVSERAGRAHVRKLARRLGLSTPIAEGPAVALGVSEASLLEMTGVYATFAAGGVSAEPWAISEILVRGDESPLMKREGPRRRVMDQRVAETVNAMMMEVVRSGTGRRAALGARPVAGKTGTTQAARDAWFIGFTGRYVAGVWMGYDDNTPLSGVTGGGLPAEIWAETLRRAEGDLPPVAIPAHMPEMLVVKNEVTESSARTPDADEPALFQRIIRDVARALSN